MQNEGYPTFIANGALAARRHVKISAGTVTDPPQVEYAGAGEYGIGITQYAAADGAPVAVKTWSDSGTFEVTASKAIAEVATVYAAASGKVSDAAVGTALGTALEAGTTDSIMEMMLTPFLATTAATVSAADAGDFFTGATTEAILAELGQNMASAQYLIAPVLIAEETGTPLTVFADGADATPGLAQLASKETAIRWNNHATPDAIAVQFLIPPDLNDGADVVAHFMGAIVKAGADEVDSPVLTVGAYFSTPGADPGADADCGGESGEFLTAANANWQEKTLTIAAADVPAAPAVLTLIINPKDAQLGTDDFVLLPPWLEATRKKLTS